MAQPVAGLPEQVEIRTPTLACQLSKADCFDIRELTVPGSAGSLGSHALAVSRGDDVEQLDRHTTVEQAGHVVHATESHDSDFTYERRVDLYREEPFL